MANVNNTANDSLALKEHKSTRITKKRKKNNYSKGELVDKYYPENVDIFLDGNLLGKTPLAGKKISYGGS